MDNATDHNLGTTGMRRVQYKHPLGVFWGTVQSTVEGQGTDVTVFIRREGDNALHVVQGSNIIKD